MTFGVLLRIRQSVDAMTAATNDLWQVSERLEVMHLQALSLIWYAHTIL